MKARQIKVPTDHMVYVDKDGNAHIDTGQALTLSVSKDISADVLLAIAHDRLEHEEHKMDGLIGDLYDGAKGAIRGAQLALSTYRLKQRPRSRPEPRP